MGKKTKKRWRRHTKEFRGKAVERLKFCDNVVALARELGVHRRLLYRWREQAERQDRGEYPPESVRQYVPAITKLLREGSDQVMDFLFW